MNRDPTTSDPLRMYTAIDDKTTVPPTVAEAMRLHSAALDLYPSASQDVASAALEAYLTQLLQPTEPLAYVDASVASALRHGQNVAGTTLTKHQAFAGDVPLYAHPPAQPTEPVGETLETCIPLPEGFATIRVRPFVDLPLGTKLYAAAPVQPTPDYNSNDVEAFVDALELPWLSPRHSVKDLAVAAINAWQARAPLQPMEPDETYFLLNGLDWQAENAKSSSAREACKDAAAYIRAHLPVQPTEPK